MNEWITSLIKRRRFWAVICEKESHTMSIGQSTHRDLVNKSSLQCILFDKFCLRHIFLDQKSGMRRIFWLLFLVRDAFDLKFVNLSTDWLVVKIVSTPVLKDHNYKMCTKQQLRKCQITNLCQVKPLEIQIAQHNFNSNLKTVYKKQRTAEEIPHLQPTDFDACNPLALCRQQRPARLFVHSRARRRLRANTCRRIKRSSGWYHSRRYRLQRFRAATRSEWILVY